MHTTPFPHLRGELHSSLRMTPGAARVGTAPLHQQRFMLLVHPRQGGELCAGFRREGQSPPGLFAASAVDFGATGDDATNGTEGSASAALSAF